MSNVKETNIINGFNKKNNEENLIDKIINNYGYKIRTIAIIFNSIFLYMISSYIIYHLAAYNIIFLNLFQVSEETLLFLGTISYFMKGLGCFFSGYLSSCFSRKFLVLFSIIGVLLLNIMIYLKLNIHTYFVFIIIGSFFSGIIDPINIDVLCETLPMKLRGFFLCFTYTGFTINVFTQYYLIWFFSKDTVEIENILICNSVAILFIVIYNIYIFQDSARHLAIKNQYEKTFIILDKYKSIPLTEEEKNIIKYQINNGNKNIRKLSIKEIFQNSYFKSSILFILMNFLSNFFNDGVVFVLNSIIIEKIPDANDEKISSIGLNIYIFVLFANLFAGILSDTPFLKRKNGLIICGFLSGLFSFMFLINVSNFMYWLGFIILSTNAYLSLSISFVSESYPTKIRDLSQGFMNTIANIGSLVGQFFYKFIFGLYNSKSLMYTGLINSIIMIIIILFVSNETYLKPLDISNSEYVSDSDNETLPETTDIKTDFLL
jgi:MFS family permease